MGLAANLAPLIDLLFPHRCPVCGIDSGSEGLCQACWSELRVPGDPCCALCQLPLDTALPGDDLTCARCMAHPPRHNGIHAATQYGEQSRALVLSLKYRRRLGLAPMMARMISGRIPDVGVDWLVVPVPLHRSRLWSRGFNQSVLLGRALAKERGWQFSPDLLVRKKKTPSLGGLSRKERHKALRGALTVHPGHADAARDRHILLVDDVLTSGATTDAAVTALRKAGAAQVKIAFFARVIDNLP